MNNIIPLYLESIKQTNKSILRNPQIILLPTLLLFGFIIVSQLLSPFGIFGGFILGIILLYFLSLYFHWIRLATQNDKITMPDLYKLRADIFFAIINTGFIFWVFEFIYGSFTRGFDVKVLTYCLGLLFTIIFNTIVENIITGRGQGLDALTRSYNFILENWVAWFTPIILIILPSLIKDPQAILVAFTNFQSRLPILPIISIIGEYLSMLRMNNILTFALCMLLLTWLMLFRVFLFIKLDSSSARSRAFKAKFNL